MYEKMKEKYTSTHTQAKRKKREKKMHDHVPIHMQLG